MAEERPIAVVGAGVMGTGVAQVLAQSGLPVVLLDRSKGQLAAAERGIRDGLRMQRLLGGTGMSRDEQARALQRVSYVQDMSDLAPARFVIENVTEDWEVKRAVYRNLDAVCRPDCVFAANTSVIPITSLASETGRPANVLGIHFMNPVPLKPTVEIIRGHHTSDTAVAAGQSLLRSMGKDGIVVSDAPGFVTNRVLMLTINEAIFLVQERVAAPHEIDQLFKGCFGHAMGPLETADLIGLDTILQSVQGLYESFADVKYRPCPLLRRMVDAGLTGRKAGQGFYSYRSTTH